MARDDTTIFDSELTDIDIDETAYDETASEYETVADNADDDDVMRLEDDVTVLNGSDGRKSDETAVIKKGEKLLDLYKVKSDAIEGGMGRVFRVHHTGWDIDLAMKQPKAVLFKSGSQKKNFIHECEAWINLGLHPHIVSCYYIRTIGGVPAIFSEWMEGGSLKDWIDNRTLYEGSKAEVTERILDIAIQFARGLHYAHEKGLIHQDVKPDNLLLTQNGDAKVADFGIAKARAVLTELDDAPADGTMFSQSGGYTPAYCSMEQMNGEKLTRRTDIWSWAISILEMFLGERPWQNGAVAGLGCESYFDMAFILIPEGIKKLLRHCLHENEAERPHDFAKIEKELLGIYKATTGNEYARTQPKAAADTADSLNNKALSFLDMGKPNEAKKCWENALKIDPKHKESIYNQTIHKWHNNDIDDLLALEYCRAEIPEFLEGIKEIMTERGEKVITKINIDVEHASGFTSSADGSLLLMWHGKTAELYKADTGKCIAEFVHDEELKTAEISEDMRYVLCWEGKCEGTHISIWNMQTQKEIFSGKARSIGKLSPDGSYYVCTQKKEKHYFCTAVYEVKTNKLLFILNHELIDQADRWFIKNSLLVLENDKKDGSFILFDCCTGKIIKTFKGHEKDGRFSARVETVAFSHDERYVISGGNDRTIRLWDVYTGQCLWVYNTKKTPCYTSFSKDSKYIISAEKTYPGSYLSIRDADTGQIVFSQRDLDENNPYDKHKEYLYNVRFNGYLLKEKGELHFVKLPKPGCKAVFRLCRIQDTVVRIKNDELYVNLLLQAEGLLNTGNIKKALSLINEARGILGYENDKRGVGLNEKIGAHCRRVGLKNILLQKSWEDEENLNNYASAKIYNKADKACENIKRNLEAHYAGVPYSTYSTKMLYCSESPDKKLWACMIAVKEEYDSPAQQDIEETVYYSIVLIDAVKQEPLWCCRDIAMDETYMERYPLSMGFSPSGKEILVPGKGLGIIDVSAAKSKDKVTELPCASLEKVYPQGKSVIDIQYARYTPDERFILMRCKNDNMVLIESDTYQELFVTRVVDTNVRGMDLSDNGNSYILKVGGSGHRLYTLDWKYEY